tara:strand:- start:367 stop:1074 length:708 start_codon:yes stop_codon:yes gene_type:complete
MIIPTLNLSKNEEYFKSSPVYFLTENLELTKLFSTLCGAQCSYGTFIENELKNFILENRKDISHCNIYEFKNKKTGIFINQDKKILDGKLPDIIIFNADSKVIVNAEIKIRADRSDGKRIPADVQGNIKITDCLKKEFKSFKVENIVVSLFEPQGGGNIEVWKKLGANIVYGKDFLKDYFNLDFSKFRMNLQKNIEVNNRIILNLINQVKKSTESKLTNKEFSSADEDKSLDRFF